MDSLSNPPEGTSGFHDTFWLDSEKRERYQSLNSVINTEIVIVGAGISGLTAAYCLAKAGKKVVVIEDGLIGSGETGRTTAHIANALDDRYSEIEKTFGSEKARLAAESHTAAISFIERTINEENIECDFYRLDGYLIMHPSDKVKTLQEEYEAARRAGLSVELAASVPDINYNGPAVRFPDQAQFHPMKYINGLAKLIIEMGGQIFCHTHADKISREGVEGKGWRVTAQEVVVATNTPVNDLVTMHTKQHPYRTYVIAAEIPKGSVSRQLWWDTGDMNSTWVAKPYHYVRTQSFNELSDLLIIGGEDHKTGQAGKEDILEEERYQNLERWAKEKFPMITNIAYTWSGQVLEPIDMMGFIGLNPGDENIYIITGDSGNGMTHGTIGGMLVSDLILSRKNPWKELYDPSRITLSTVVDYLSENTNMALQYGDFFTAGDGRSLGELKTNEGMIVRTPTGKVALYKDPDAKLHAYSAICPHLGCHVRWNNDEKSFDCPCHGSRFTCEGKVVNGPSNSDLKPMDIQALLSKSEERKIH